MPDKKTEITFGFSPHFPSMVKKSLPYEEEADIIILEGPQVVIDKFIKSRKKISKDELLKYTPHPETNMIAIRQLRRMREQGKTILPLGSYSTDKWTKEERGRFDRLMERADGYNFEEDVENLARAVAEMNKLVNEKNVEWIKKNLPGWKGKKVFIQMGAGHAPVYHQLRRELKGVSIKAAYLTAGKYENPRIKYKRDPQDQLVSMLTYGTRLSKNRLVVRKRVRQQHEYNLVRKGLEGRYEAQGMSHEKAHERAVFETLRKQTSRGLRR
jgi:hypothetical protein